MVNQERIGAAVSYKDLGQERKRRLARLLLEWEALTGDLMRLTEEIEQIVLAAEETVVVSNVRATYSKGRSVYDYKQPVLDYEDVNGANSQLRKDHTVHVEEQVIPAHDDVDWTGLCEAYNLERVEVKPGVPSVKLKLETD